MSTFDSINPYTLEKNWTFTRHTNEELDTIIQTAHSAYLDWKDTTFAHRQQLFLKLADLFEDQQDELARLETIEMWVLHSFSKNVMRWSAKLIRRFANNVEDVLWTQEFETNEWHKGVFQYDPLGVIFGVAPWNFPFYQVLKAAAANIIAGNTTIYKHSSNVPLCGQKLEDLFLEAGFPKWVYTNIYTSGSQSEHIISNPLIAWVNLTGGERAGSAVWALAGKYLKPSVLELWGNDAFVVLDHSDTPALVADAVACRINNGGQRCNGSKRFILLEQYYDEFVEQMWQYMSTQVKRWDPMDAETQLPPLSSADQVAEVHDQVTRSLADGARLVTGGKILWDHWQFYAPTLLADVTPEMTSFREEVFGPVASITKAKNTEEAIALANNSEFGLSATVRWDDIQQLKDTASQLECGAVFINNPAWSKASFGIWWIKKSWYGRENGPEGLKSFTNKKTIVYSIK